MIEISGELKKIRDLKALRFCSSQGLDKKHFVLAVEYGFQVCFEEMSATHVPRADVQRLISALRYGVNEMKYRIHQIEGGHEIPMTGEMHTFVEMAREALKEFK